MKALVLFALQNDFYIGGMLEHPRAASIIQGIQKIIPNYYRVIAIKKEHPHHHPIFAANHPWRKPWQTIQGERGEITLWPFHTIEGTFGAEWIPHLQLPPNHLSISVGSNSEEDYRNFFENPTFSQYLEKEQINELHFAGFCFTEGIHQTAIHAKSIGIKSLILTSLISSVSELEELQNQYLQH
jgi:nicotinamidase/pyrazinamidase